MLHWSGQAKLIDNIGVVGGQCVVHRRESMDIWMMRNPVEDVTVLMGCCGNGLRKAKSFDQVQQFGCACV